MRLRRSGETLIAALRDHLSDTGIPHQIVGDPVADYRDVMRGNPEHAKHFNQRLRRQGILKPESKFYISLALEDDDRAQTVDAIAEAATHVMAA
ncbi:MAG: hypothetical protein ACR2Q4_03855 [Geminicoccaceae bacterium]